MYFLSDIIKSYQLEGFRWDRHVDLFLSTIVTRTRRHTELTKKSDKPDGKPLLCQRQFSSVFRAVFYTVKLHSLTYIRVNISIFTSAQYLFSLITIGLHVSTVIQSSSDKTRRGSSTFPNNKQRTTPSERA